MGRLVTREFMNNYNKKLESYYKGEKYINDSKRTDAELEKWLPRLIEYTRELSLMMMQYKDITGEEMESRNVLGGFNIIE